MVTVTKTIHSLPFDQLEPKRFEDLIRQLAYDFRTWRALEATGSSGTDDSYDIRGYETVMTGEPTEPDEIDEVENSEATEIMDRLWLIQCKREKEIGPSKLIGYVNAIPIAETEKLHGVIIAASCNISKVARDQFVDRCRMLGLSECYIWSRAEIEDMLFQPKNDGLLFAYFGISLTIRRRSVATRIRSRLSTKRKLIRALGSGELLGINALFLDPEEESYPYVQDESTQSSELPWRVHRVERHHPRGIIVVARMHVAYLHDDRVHWDVADKFNHDTEVHWNPWADDAEKASLYKTRQALSNIQAQWPRHNHATATITCLLEYSDIIEVDKDGDPMFSGPIIYVAMKDGKIPYTSVRCELVSDRIVGDTQEGRPPELLHEKAQLILQDTNTNRIEKFPQEYRRIVVPSE
jgi:hypothetical protein